MKVYIVTSGDYSDYHIERAFSTQEKAQEYLDHIGNGDSLMIEEFELDEETPRGTFGYHVTITKYKNRNNTTVNLIDFGDSPDSRKDAFQWICNGSGFPNSVWFNIEAKDAPHAIKIASERLMQIEAMPYLFPLLKERCVCNKHFYSIQKNTPIYDYNTKETILYEHEWLES